MENCQASLIFLPELPQLSESRYNNASAKADFLCMAALNAVVIKDYFYQTLASGAAQRWTKPTGKMLVVVLWPRVKEVFVRNLGVK